jgi:hypothetical protein
MNQTEMLENVEYDLKELKVKQWRWKTNNAEGW